MNTLTSLTTSAQGRRKYLISCIRVSLIKRWYLLIGSPILGAVLAYILGWSQIDQAILGLACAVLSATLIAVQSWQRHIDDMPSLRLTTNVPQSD